MKSRFFVIRNFKRKILIFLLAIIIAIIVLVYRNISLSKDSLMVMPQNIQIPETEVKIEEIENRDEKELGTAEKEENTGIEPNGIESDIPKELKGYPVIGKIEIPKIELVTYILSETNKKTMGVSVTKFFGPEVNKVGNLCITGHNYNKPRMFGKLKEVGCGDKIYVTDLTGKTIIYNVYAIDKIKPTEIECLSQETGRRKRININYLYNRSYKTFNCKSCGSI